MFLEELQQERLPWLLLVTEKCEPATRADASLLSSVTGTCG